MWPCCSRVSTGFVDVRARPEGLSSGPKNWGRALVRGAGDDHAVVVVTREDVAHARCTGIGKFDRRADVGACSSVTITVVTVRAGSSLTMTRRNGSTGGDYLDVVP